MSRLRELLLECMEGKDVKITEKDAEQVFEEYCKIFPEFTKVFKKPSDTFSTQREEDEKTTTK